MKQYLFVSILLLILQPLSLHAKGKQNFSKNSLCFIENKGQIKDPNHVARNYIDYKMDAGNGLNVFVGRGGLCYQWSKQNSNGKSENSEEKLLHNKVLRITDSELRTDMYRMDVELLGANMNAEAVVEEEQNYYERYYATQFGEKGAIAHSYKKITYKNIYPHIDWVLYVGKQSDQSQHLKGHSHLGSEIISLSKSLNGLDEIVAGQACNDNPQRLEYDFVVHPGGNVKDIKLKYRGVTDLSQNNDGEIKAITPMGSVTEERPYSYEQESGKIITSKFVLKGDTISFKINPDSYRDDATIVIDPSLLWASYYGGTNEDQGLGVSTDSKGNVYITGTTYSTNGISTPGAYQSMFSGNVNAFLVKLNSYGVRLWATYYGGDTGTFGFSVACNDSDNVYVCGSTLSSTGIATTGAFQTTIAGGSDAFLVKFDSSGARQWGTYYGGANYEDALGVTVSNTADVYFIVRTYGSSGMASPGAYQTTFSGSGEKAVLVKFSGNGARLWATYYDGTGIDIPDGVTTDDSGNVYMTGFTSSTSGIATAGAYQANLNFPNGSAFLVKFNDMGSRQWATYYGDTNSSSGAGVCTDHAGNVYMCGVTRSITNIASPGAAQTSLSGTLDAFLVKFNNNGIRQWGTYFGGPDSDYATSVACDTLGNIYITGYTNSPSGIAMPGAYQPVYGGGIYDAFLAEFSNAGIKERATYYGGPGKDFGTGVCTDDSGKVYITGYTNSTSGIATNGAHQTSYGGGTYDAFIAKFYSDTFVAISQPYTDTILCARDSFYLPYFTNDTFRASNIFTGQISDSSGSFSSPVNIGTLAATTTDSILCFIPGTMLNGSHYRIRIIASHPIDTSEDDGLNIRLINLTSPTGSSNSPVCEGDSLKLFAVDTLTGIGWQWTGPNNFNSVNQNPVIHPAILADSGFYTVKASLPGCFSEPDTVHAVIIANAPPSVIITTYPSPMVAGQITTFTAHITYGGTAPFFKWYLNGQYNSSSNDSVYTITPAGGDTICVVAFSNLSCANPDSAIACIGLSSLLVKTSLAPFKGEVTVYPNPASSFLYIQANGRVNISITDIEGKVLLPYTSSPLERQGEVNISTLTTGLYLIKIYDENGYLLKVEKLVKD